MKTKRHNKGQKVTLESVARDIESLAAITKGGFENVDKRLESVDEHFKKLDRDVFSLDSKVESIDRRLAGVERVLGPVAQNYSLLVREVQNLNIRVAKLERKVA